MLYRLNNIKNTNITLRQKLKMKFVGDEYAPEYASQLMQLFNVSTSLGAIQTIQYWVHLAETKQSSLVIESWSTEMNVALGPSDFSGRSV